MAIITSVVTGGSNSHATTSAEANSFATDFISQGVVGSIANTLGVAPATGAFAVNAQGTPAMFVDVTAGVAYITATPSSQTSQTLRAYMSAASTSYAISANASGSTKYDWIYLKVDPTKAGGTEDAAADDVTALYTSRSSSNTADNASPPTYGILLAIITVANGASSITNANILDSRAQAAPSAQVSSSGSGWSTSTVPTSATCLGQRSYQIVFNSTDLTGSLSPGMRLRTTRTVAPPTQCTSLNGSSQYFNKTSPAGTIGTATDDITAMAWIKLTSYTVGASTIISKRNATNGFQLRVEANTGCLAIYGFGTAGAYRGFTTYQSIPLNKWIHVSASLDMSGNTTTTNKFFFDGIEVPAQAVAGAGAVTAFIQAGNLDIGASQSSVSATEFFPGKIAQAAVFSGNASTITQTLIRGYISQAMTGAEANCIGAWSFNNSLNDSNASANNLTAQGSAVATNADSPFSGALATGIDFGIITAASFSTNTTLTVQVPEGYAIPTTGGISALSYSTVDIPYGFPGSINKWRLTSIRKTSDAVTSNASYGAFLAGGWALTVSVGEWSVGWQGDLYNLTTTPVYFNIATSALTGLTNITGANASPFACKFTSAAASATQARNYVQQPQSVTAVSTYVMYTLGGTTSAGSDGSTALTEIFAEFGYL